MEKRRVFSQCFFVFRLFSYLCLIVFVLLAVYVSISRDCFQIIVVTLLGLIIAPILSPFILIYYKTGFSDIKKLLSRQIN
jgi:hypothetical protein